MSGIKKDILDMSYNNYDKIMGIDDFETTKDGLIRLVPTTKYVDKAKEKVTTSIRSLEDILKEQYKEKENLEKIEIKAKKEEAKSKDKKKKKKQKEEKQSLLKAIFSAVDSEEETDPEGGEYVDKKERKKREKKDDTLDTQLGKRFSTVVSYVHDTIHEFDLIEKQIKEEIDANKNKAKGMYLSSMTANLISAKTGKLNAIKELTAINKTLTDLEIKKAKESKEDDKDDNKLIASFGASLLKGKFSDYEDEGKKKNKKKKNKFIDDDDEEDDDDEDDRNLSKELARSLKENKRDLSFTAHERHIEMEGKYKLIVVADPFNPQEDWKFVAVDKNGEKIDNFAEDYKGIIPKKKNCKMVFDTTKMEVKDRATSKRYKLVFRR